MNWDKGLKRITFVLSVVGAIIAAGFVFRYSNRLLSCSKGILAEERRKPIYVGGLVREWKEAKTFAEQESLWTEWTGERLPKDAWWQRLSPRDPNENMPEGFIPDSPSLEDIPQLKELGWQTVREEPLPLTPQGVWFRKHDRRIKDLETTVRENLIKLVISLPIGAAIGFGAVWAMYAATKYGAFSLLIWIRNGFREDRRDGGSVRT